MFWSNLICRQRRRGSFLRTVRLEDRCTPATLATAVSAADPSMYAVAAGGTLAPGGTSGSVESPNQRRMSDDGRYIVFDSRAGNVVAGQIDSNGVNDVFVHDRQTNTTELISHLTGNLLKTGNDDSYNPSISVDGRYVAFASNASDLAGGITKPAGSTANVFWYDRVTQACVLASHAYNNSSVGCSAGVNSPMVSADGQSIVFMATSDNLIVGYITDNYQYHLYVWSNASGSNALIDHKFGLPTTAGLGGIDRFESSTDGRYIAFSNGPGLTNLSTGPNGGIYVHDRVANSTILVTKSLTTGAGSIYSGSHSVISADGKWIVYESTAIDVVSGYSGAGRQIFAYDVANAQTILVSHAWYDPLVGADAASGFSYVSGDGRYVTYQSQATDLIPNFIDGNAGQNPSNDLFMYDRVTDTTTLITRQAGSTATSGNNGWSEIRGISGDGKYVLFHSRATDLISGFQATNGPTFGSTYLYDRTADKMTAINTHFGSTTQSGNGESVYSDISFDGSTIAFTTASSDIIPGLLDVNGADDVFARDVATGAVSLVSRRSGAPSVTAGGDSDRARISADGRFVVFQSKATNLVAGQTDNENTQDIFLRDRQTNTDILVSRSFGTTNKAANANSALPMISADGRFVTYYSFATNLINGFVDNNGPEPPDVFASGAYNNADVFLFDRLTGQTQLVSCQAGTTNVGGNNGSGTFTVFEPLVGDFSADGRYVTYYSLATDLVAGFVDHNGTTASYLTGADIFVFDRLTGTNRLVTHTPGSDVDGANDHNYAPKISGDGRYITYWSYAYTLVSGMPTLHRRNIFVFDQQTGITTLASHIPTSTTAGGGGWSTDPAISADGNFIAYISLATNLVTGSDGNGQWDVFLYDRQANTNALVSHAINLPTTAGNYVCGFNSFDVKPLSADGRYVVYSSAAQNLVANFIDNNGINPSGDNIYVFDRVTGTNKLVSHHWFALNSGGNAPFVGLAEISGDGRFISYNNSSTNLVQGFSLSSQTSTPGNIYLYDQFTGKNVLVSQSIIGTNVSGNTQSGTAHLSYDGAVVTYDSSAANLIAGDQNGKTDIFALETLPPRVSSLQINDGSAQRSIVKSITLTFDEPIFFSGNAADAFTLTRQGTVGSVQLSVVSQNVPNGTVTITFGGSLTEFGSLIDGNYTLSIDASMVSNIANLDGNGDGVAGDNYVASFHRLFGDADGDRAVAASDFILFRTAFNNASLIFDFDNDGAVAAADFIQFRLRFGGSI